MPHFAEGEEAVRRMLAAMRLPSVDALFDDIPKSVRTQLNLPKGQSELAVRRRAAATLGRNRNALAAPHFLGAGIYHHHSPPEVRYLASRSEFLTSYTPYQSEISQGMLQAIFEFQTMVCELTGMDAANASMYDGASALAEAALLSARATDRNTILLPRALFWEKRSCIENYCRSFPLRIVEYGYDARTGEADLADLSAKLTSDVAGVVVGSPNFFGLFESRGPEIVQLAHARGALALFDVNPISLGLQKGPGAYGADVVVGEGQCLGQDPGFGGPGLGLFAVRKEHVRRMPGRIVGQTVDARGDRAFCLTLQTREQHIRRDKATSNICTNEGLNALSAAIYLACVGGKGLARIAKVNATRARAVARRIARLPGYRAPAFEGFHFNEFVVRHPRPAADVNERLNRQGLHGGLSLARQFPELADGAVYCVTETTTDEAIERLVGALSEVRA
ncbi:MAG TPA: aminomethyl-transferring glycine dehydrogenase subunit GcvPA [Candidatus Thermoplasmatota archaeon]|nr:aminomethyl-transferring glycine dehydrogenase subunit GcvPA [Candidatus Thermoplasmatota archaeon]